MTGKSKTPIEPQPAQAPEPPQPAQQQQDEASTDAFGTTSAQTDPDTLQP